MGDDRLVCRLHQQLLDDIVLLEVIGAQDEHYPLDLSLKLQTHLVHVLGDLLPCHMASGG